MSVMTATDHRIPKDVADLLATPAAYADGRIHEAYRWLRANEPLGVADIEGMDPFWVVTRHADILEISRQNDLFHNGDRSPTPIGQEGDRKIREMMGGSPHLLRTLIHMDAPDHLKYRALTQGWFMPQNLRRLEDQIRVLAKAAVERMAATGGRCDFVKEVALHYPLHVIMSIMGVPEEDEPADAQAHPGAVRRLRPGTGPRHRRGGRRAADGLRRHHRFLELFPRAVGESAGEPDRRPRQA